jgi:Fe-S cluster assembly ATP-binding protein
MLEVRNLHVQVDDKEILKGVDITVAPGEAHSIMGPNGSGKSTLAQVLAGRETYISARNPKGMWNCVRAAGKQ